MELAFLPKFLGASQPNHQRGCRRSPRREPTILEGFYKREDSNLRLWQGPSLGCEGRRTESKGAEAKQEKWLNEFKSSKPDALGVGKQPLRPA